MPTESLSGSDRRCSLHLSFAAAILIGLAERIGWAFARKTPWATGEAPNVAMALAHGRGFADAFFAGQGPTAHLLPIAPAIAGGVYWLLGSRTHAAEAVLCVWSLALTATCYLFLADAFRRIGIPRAARIGGLLFLFVAPIYTTNETFEFRVWEGGLGLALASATLFVLLRAEEGVRPRGFAVLRAVLPALTFFVNPPVGLAAFAAWALFTWRHRRADGLIRPAVAAILALSVLIGPWALRNDRVMGHAILLRDDLGLELALANYPGAVEPVDPDRALLSRLQDIHPYIHPTAYRAMWAAGGEVAYSQMLKRQALSWMRDHPGDVARIWIRHVREILFTRNWMFRTTHARTMPIIRSALMTFVGALGLLGLLMAARRRDTRYLYAAAYVLIPALCYIPFQPVIRYTWLIYPALVYLAADACTRIAVRIGKPQSSSSS